MVSIDAACKGGMLKASNTDKIIVDTTVMLKDIAPPKDSRLLEKRAANTWTNWPMSMVLS